MQFVISFTHLLLRMFQVFLNYEIMTFEDMLLWGIKAFACCDQSIFLEVRTCSKGCKIIKHFYYYNSYMQIPKMQRKNSPVKNQTVLRQLSARKMKQMNQITMTRNDEQAQLQPVLSNGKEEDKSLQRTCPKCSFQGKMNQQLKMGCVSWSWVVCLLLFTFVLFPVPYFCNSCKDKIYYCPICGETIDRQFAKCL